MSAAVLELQAQLAGGIAQQLMIAVGLPQTEEPEQD